jgi:hypothetical protein
MAPGLGGGSLCETQNASQTSPAIASETTQTFSPGHTCSGAQSKCGGRARSFAFNILKANHTGIATQDRRRACLGGFDNLLKLFGVT